MSEVLLSALWFVLAVGVLITVHEFGHFWVARLVGVKVLRFSVGFGRPLLSWRSASDQTEYVVAALPLGGYVKMLDETEGDVPEQEVHRAFNRQPIASRVAIVAAGPAFNFLFAILAYWIMFMVGVTGVRPVVGAVTEGSIAAQAGLKAGDEILAVAGQRTATWETAILELLPKVMDGEPAELQIQDPGRGTRDLTLDLSGRSVEIEGSKLLPELGIRPWRPDIPPIIGRIVSGGAAQAAGLQAGDRIVSADGIPIGDWDEWVEYVRSRPGRAISAEVERAGQTIAVRLTPEAVTDDSGNVMGRIGAAVALSDASADEAPTATLRYNPLRALVEGVGKTWQMTTLTLHLLYKMVVGQASWENISGPISIAQYAGQAASVGVATFLAFLGLVSVSLGVLNLLPVPVLDGGHLLYYGIEAVKGSPVSEQGQLLGQRIGMALLLALMALAFYNDLARLFY